MEKALPISLRLLIAAYLQALEPLRAHFYGIYIYGSIALDAFEEQASDIDILALTQGEWSPLELKQLKVLHKQLAREHTLGGRMEVCYVPQNYLGVMRPDRKHGTFAPYPGVHDGAFLPATYAGLNAVTWWIIKNRGYACWDQNPASCPSTFPGMRCWPICALISMSILRVSSNAPMSTFPTRALNSR